VAFVLVMMLEADMRDAILSLCGRELATEGAVKLLDKASM
jgi:hypothetical protein